MNELIARSIRRAASAVLAATLVAVVWGAWADAAAAQATVLAPRAGLEIFTAPNVQLAQPQLTVKPLPGVIVLTAATSSLQVDDDLPANELTVDISSYNADILDMVGSDRPEDLASAKFDVRPSTYIDGSMMDYSLMMWDVLNPARFCHRPLYFEDVHLERYGQCWGHHQPTASAVLFLGDVFLLPAKMIRQHHNSYVYTPHPLH